MKTRLDLLKPEEINPRERNVHMEKQWKEFKYGAEVYYKLYKQNCSRNWIPTVIVGRDVAVNYTIKLSGPNCQDPRKPA